MTDQAAFTWKQAPDLMERLTAVQNHPAFANQDIMSFAGMCSSRDELQDHVWACSDRTEEFDGVFCAAKI